MNRAGSLLLGMMFWMGLQDDLTAEEPSVKRSGSRGDAPSITGSKTGKLPLPVALETLPAKTRESLTKVIQAPTLAVMSPADEFAASSELYLWLLDHPDRVSLAWQRMNITAVDITVQQDGKFCWKDELGSELTWRSVAQSGDGRIWYAEGKIRPGSLLPLVSVKAVAVLRHGVKKDEGGDSVICHQVEVFLQTDSRAATLVMRLLGPAAPRLAQDGTEQLLLFFSGIARHLDRHPSRAKALLAEKN